MKNKIISLLLAVVMMMTLIVPVTVYSEEEETALPQETVEVIEEVVEEEAPVEVSAEEEVPAEVSAEEEVPAEVPAEEEAPAEVPAEEEEAPAEEPAEEEEAPAEEPAEEEEAPAEEPAEEEEAPAEEPAEEEEAPAEEPAEEEEAPAEEPAEEEEAPAEEPAEEAFTQGYVRVNGETVVYQSESRSDEYGHFAGSAVVYASVTSRASDPAYDWLKIVFDTEEDILTGYVQFKDVTVLSEEAAEEIGQNAELREYNGKKLPVVSFVKKVVEEEAEETETVETEPAQAAAAITISTQPADVSVIVGNYATFTVAAAGEGLTYQWQTKVSASGSWKTSSFGGNKTATLNFKAAMSYSGRQFRCVITDANGNTATSNAATLTVTEQPAIQIVTEPEDATVVDGENAVFTVEAIGDGLTYQWQTKLSATGSWRTSSFNGNKTATLNFKVSQNYSGRQFRCVITDSEGNTETTKAVTLTVTEKPAIQIVTAPVDVEVEEGKTAVFTVVATGEGLTYQWQTKLSATGSWRASSFNGNKTSTMSFTSALSYSGRQFRCVITDAEGNTVTTDPVVLTVTEKTVQFEIVKNPENAEVEEGVKVKFSVEATGDGLTYQWQTKLSETGNWSNTSLSGNKTAEITLTAKKAYNGRYYRCVVTDENGEVLYSEGAQLTVIIDSTIEIQQQPVDVEVVAGNNAVFTVVATGEGLTYQWQTKLSATGSWKTSSFNGNKTATLDFKASQSYSGRQFRCVITDANGNTETTDAALLTVLEQPAIEIVTQPVDTEVTDGDTAEFTVEAIGEGLTYQWQTKLSATSSWKNSGFNGNKTATMSFKAALSYSGRMFRCIITDSEGNTETTNEVVLTVVDRPAIEIVTQPVDTEVIEGEHAVFTVEAIGNGLTYQWQTKLSPTGSWKVSSFNGNKTAELNFKTSLSYDGRQFRCVITDEDGNVEISEAVVLTVNEKPPIQIVTPPTDAEVCAGETVEFTVEAIGEDLTYQWQTKLSPTGSWKVSSFNGNKTATLSFKASASYDGRLFRCVITDANENTLITDEVLLTISSNFIVDEVEYQILSDGSLSVVKYHGSAANVTIPEVVNEKTVKEIGEGAFEGNATLVSIDLPDTVTAIRARAFKNCTSLSEMK